MRRGTTMDAGGAIWCTACRRCGRCRTKRWIRARSHSITWAASEIRAPRGTGRTVSKRRLRCAGAVLSTMAILLQGCYETLPLQEGSPPETAGVQLVMNDKGRVEVSTMLGGEVDKVEGTLVAQNSASYTLAVSQVYTLGGSS